METAVLFQFCVILITCVSSEKPCAETTFDAIDKDKNGFIDGNELASCFTPDRRDSVTELEFLDAIKNHKFATCGLSAAYVFKVFSKKRSEMSVSEVLRDNYDSDNDGNINLKEFRYEHYHLFLKWMRDEMGKLLSDLSRK